MADYPAPPYHMRPLAVGIISVAAFVAGCSHEEPYTTAPERSAGPAVPGNPAVLTRNPLQDLYPVWSPDGSSILYTYESSPVENRDRCLGLLPAAGGTRLAQICSTSAGHLDSTEAYGPSALSPAGRLAYRYAQSIPGRLNPSVEELRVATLANPHDHQVINTFPTNIEGTKIDGVGAILWLSETRLVYLALKVQYASPAPGAPRDTLIDGLAVVLVDLVGGTPPAIVPGTLEATSVAPTDGIEAITYTLAGDSRVYRQSLASGAVSTVHDFGTLGIARDAVLRDDRLVAVVGGLVTYFVDPELGTRQPDAGGLLYRVDLATGTTMPLAGGAPYYFRRPAPSPTGALVVEGYFDDGFFVSPRADILLLEPTAP